MVLSSIRLLQLMKTLDLGGLEKTVIAYSNLLADKLGSVHIYSFQGGLYEDNGFIRGNVRTYKSPARWLKPFLSIPSLLKLIQQEKINIIIYHQRIFLPAIYCIKLLFPKTIIIYKGHSVFNDLLNRFLFADKFIAVSRAVQNDLIKAGKKNIHILYHGITVPPERKDIESIRTIGFIGRFNATKGIDALLAAFGNINKDYVLRLELRGAGEFETEIRNFISTNKLGHKINILPPSVNENEIYGGIDILVLPSISHEGFGLVLIEAMSRGIPVISASIGGTNEIIESGTNGLLFKSGSHTELEKKLRLLIEDEQLRNKLINNGIKTVAGKYRVENTIENYFKLLESL